MAHHVSVTAEPDRNYCIDRLEERRVGLRRRCINKSYLRRFYDHTVNRFAR
jgi:hypothetical protein